MRETNKDKLGSGNQTPYFNFNRFSRPDSLTFSGKYKFFYLIKTLLFPLSL